MLCKMYDEEKSQVLQAIMPALDLSEHGFTPLHLAVLDLSPSPIAEVLRHYPSFAIDAKDGFDRSSLWWAARRGNFDTVELLLQHHADPNQADGVGVSPITSAITARSDRCLELLLNSGVDINQLNPVGNTPLLDLAYNNDTNLFDILIRHNPDLNIRGEGGDSALLAALEYRNDDIAKRLIQIGADIHIKEHSGYNALSVAILFSAHAIIQMLLDRQADHHGTIKQHGTLLHLIAGVADLKTLRILTTSTLARRDVQVKRSDGKTAVELAQARTETTREWQDAFYAFIWSVDKTKTRVSPIRTGGDQVQAENSDGEGDVFHDAIE